MLDGLEAWFGAPTPTWLTLILVLILMEKTSEKLGALAKTLNLLESKLNYLERMNREDGKQVDRVLSVLRDVESTVSVLNRNY